jgi:hypothetical protein
MSDTYYAIKRRERQRVKENAKAAEAKNVTPEPAVIEAVEEPSYDRKALQAQAKELGIAANQSNDALAEAIEKATAG